MRYTGFGIGFSGALAHEGGRGLEGFGARRHLWEPRRPRGRDECDAWYRDSCAARAVMRELHSCGGRVRATETETETELQRRRRQSAVFTWYRMDGPRGRAAVRPPPFPAPFPAALLRRRAAPIATGDAKKKTRNGNARARPPAKFRPGRCRSALPSGRVVSGGEFARAAAFFSFSVRPCSPRARRRFPARGPTRTPTRGGVCVWAGGRGCRPGRGGCGCSVKAGREPAAGGASSVWPVGSARHTRPCARARAGRPGEQRRTLGARRADGGGAARGGAGGSRREQ